MNVIQRLREARSAEQLAEEIEPLAQALASLAEESMGVLEAQKSAAQDQAKSQRQALAELKKTMEKTSAAIQILEETAATAQRAASGWSWKLFVGVLAASVVSLVVLLVGLSLWLEPEFVSQGESVWLTLKVR